MIIPKLAEYYDRLAADPESDVAELGFSRQRIGFEVVLQPDGALFEIQDARIEDGKRQVAATLTVPGQSKPSGSGINPGFLWDNAAYMLGFKPDDPNPKRTLQCFEAFRDRHLALREEIDDEAFHAVCKFLETWDPERAKAFENLEERTTAFGVFRIVGQQGYVHERPAVKSYWRRSMAREADAVVLPSLVSGEPQPIARLHEPKIKGVVGGQSSGTTLVSFNADAYESYGKDQSYNAPVGEADAFKYCTALNQLTNNRERRVVLADTTVVYWSEKPTAFENELFGALEPTTEDQGTLDALRDFFRRLRRAAEQGVQIDDADVPFYVLGLAPNAARISVRFWLAGTVQQFAERLGQHLADLELAGAPPNAPPMCVQRIVDQCARERKDIPPLLSGAVLRAVLSGSAYPVMLITSVLRRIRADRNVWHPRVAILKAHLTRKARLAQREEYIAVSLDPECPHTAYQLGRLFAALEKTQEDALGGDLNVTIKDRFLSSASATPGNAFSRLLRMHAHHLDKLSADKRGLKVNREKLVQEIMARIPAERGFPKHLSLDEQGRFFIGYYHQRNSFFQTKSDAGADTGTEE